jgi:hypothetical protein
VSVSDRIHVARERLLARLPAADASIYLRPGELPLGDLPFSRAVAEDAGAIIAASDTGAAIFPGSAATTVVVPPFPVNANAAFEGFEPAPLVELLERRRAVAVFLLRLGGFSVGFFRGDALVDSKTDSRFVKNRHRKGGQSQRRFDRIREKQIDELFDDACRAAARTLMPYDAEIEHVFLGGTKQTLMTFRKQCQVFDRFGARLRARVLTITADPRLATLEAMPREIWSSDIYTFPNA